MENFVILYRCKEKSRRRLRRFASPRLVYYIDFLRIGMPIAAYQKYDKEDGPMYDLEPAFILVGSQGSGRMARVLSLAVNHEESILHER